MTAPRSFPKPQPHGAIKQLFPDIFFVTGAMTMRAPLPMTFSRNMTIVRQNGELTLINSVRLSEPGLKELEQLGEIKHVVRLAAFHGIDDPFYQHRYQATIWSVDAPYVRSFHRHPDPAESYFSPDVTLSEHCVLPLAQAKYFELKTGVPREGLLWLKCNDGVMISGDALQNWATPDEFFNLFAKLAMRAMGFFKPCAVGLEWYKLTQPNHDELRNLLDYDFEHLLPGHGAPVIGNARNRYEPALRKY